MWRALCRFVSTKNPPVVVITDHQPFVFANAKGCSKAYFVNEVLKKISSSFPDVEISFLHLPGEKIPADKLSRGEGSLDEGKLGEALARVRGSANV